MHRIQLTRRSLGPTVTSLKTLRNLECIEISIKPERLVSQVRVPQAMFLLAGVCPLALFLGMGAAVAEFLYNPRRESWLTAELHSASLAKGWWMVATRRYRRRRGLCMWASPHCG